MNKLFILLISAALFSYCQPTTTDTENLEESSDSLTTGVTTEVVPIRQAPTYVEESASVPPAPKRPKVVTETEEASNEPLKEVDVKAVFPGCESHKKLARRDICTTRSWRDYVEDNLEFGDSILLDKSSDDVVVQFVIEKDGAVSDLKIIKDFGQESVRSTFNLFAKMKQDSMTWTPALVGGEPVRYVITELVTFTK